MKAKAQKYDNVMIALHWVIGIGIILLAGTELFRQEFPKGHFIREGLKPIHMPLGTILFMLILVRVAWRLKVAEWSLFDRSRSLQDTAAAVVHLALYGLMVGLPLLGLVYVFGTDKAVDFGLFNFVIPLKAYIGDYAKSARSLHETFGIAILALAFLHAIAALGHHYILKDGLLNKMRFQQRQKIQAAE